MTTAFVLDNETVLCRHTVTGWYPIQIDLPPLTANSIDNDAAQDEANRDADTYQLGRVPLLESLAPSHWTPENLAVTKKMTANENVPASIAMTQYYARNNGIDLPTITDVSTAGNVIAADSIAFITYRQLITYLPVALAAQLSQAIQLLRWQADTQFCSRCSAPVTPAQSGERAMVCAVCHLRQYPRVQPCVITAITRPNPQTGEMQILLAHHHRYGSQSSPLQYGLIAGFVEVGESLEHAVVREVAEEVGISVTNIRYVSSQPWPFPSNLMLGFQAAYADGDIVIQEDELSHAAFFDISALPKIPFKGSIAYELIEQIVHEQGLTL